MTTAKNIERDALYANITDCRARLLRGMVDNRTLGDVIQEVEENTKAVLGLPNAAMMYNPLTEGEGHRLENARLQNPMIDQMVANSWTIVAAKINTLYVRAGFKFRVEEFFTRY